MSIKYKGYGFKYCIDEENGVLFGEVVGINDVITFQADSVAGLIREFEASVDDYLAFCEESGVEPKKPYSGKFVVRINPELHREAAALAESQGGSLNSLISKCVEEHLESVGK
jgi:predicted HicB family RNase H-like nuclease